MKPRTLAVISGVAILAVWAMPIELAAQTQLHYSITDLGTLGGSFSLGAGLNNEGWVSGFSTTAGDQQIHATLWAKGQKKDLGTLGGPNSQAFFRPSERGTVVGRAETSAPDPFGQDACGFNTYLTCLPVVWKNGVTTPLPTLGGSFGSAFVVNNRGQIAGVAAVANADPTCVPPVVQGFKPVLWEDGEIQELPTIAGDPDGFAQGINDEGQAVGGTGNCAQTGLNQTTHAVLWENGAAIDLGNLGGTTNNLAFDINNRGHVVGKSNISGDTTSHAFFWREGTMSDLGTLAGDFSSQADAINSRGKVVGLSCDASGNCQAFLWQNGVMTDLNTLFPANSPLHALEALEINARGVITGYALQLSTGQVHAFLATPITDDASEAVTPAMVGESIARPKVTLPENIRRSSLDRARIGVIHAQ